MSVQLRLRALAKINIDLRVLYKRPDGYHEVRTIFQTIALADVIQVTYLPSRKLSISIEGNMTPALSTEDNLITRAAELVAKELHCGAQLRVHLDKRIPLGAGLGGGSSDAAAMLLALPRLMSRSIASERLHEMAALLGSDVPFFLYGGTAVGLGRGEELYPLPDLPRLPGLLVTPGIRVSTAEAYRSLGACLDDSSRDRKRLEFSQLIWTEDLAAARNDFEDSVFELHPELGRIRQTLQDSGAVCARMTGSGSSIFGLFRDTDARTRAQTAMTGRSTFPFSLISRKRYRAAMSRQSRSQP